MPAAAAAGLALAAGLCVPRLADVRVAGSFALWVGSAPGSRQTQRPPHRQRRSPARRRAATTRFAPTSGVKPGSPCVATSRTTICPKRTPTRHWSCQGWARSRSSQLHFSRGPSSSHARSVTSPAAHCPRCADDGTVRVKALVGFALVVASGVTLTAGTGQQDRGSRQVSCVSVEVVIGAEALPGATVTLAPEEPGRPWCACRAVTDANGKVWFSAWDAGRYSVTVEVAGYKPAKASVAVSPPHANSITVLLEQSWEDDRTIPLWGPTPSPTPVPQCCAVGCVQSSPQAVFPPTHNHALDLPGLSASQACLSYPPLVAKPTRTTIQLLARQVSAGVVLLDHDSAETLA